MDQNHESDNREPSILELTAGLSKFARVLQEAVTLRKAHKPYMMIAGDPQILEAINRLVSEPTKKTITDIISERGLEDPEVKELFEAWVAAHHARIELTVENNNPQPGIAFLVTTAGVYFSAGYYDKAIDALNDAKHLAISTKNPQLIEELHINARLQKIQAAIEQG